MARQPKLKHVKFVRSKGQLYAYFNTGKKVNGKTVYNPLPRFGTVGFYESYASMLAARTRRQEVALTVSKLIEQYQRSEDWKRLSDGSRQLYRLTLLRVAEQIGNFRVEKVERRHIREILANRIEGNGAANIFLALVGIIYRWGKDNDLIPEAVNPTGGIKMRETGQHEPWPQSLIDAALACDHDRVRLAVHLLLYTGQRIGDVMRMRWSDIRGDAIYVDPQKTRSRKQDENILRIPLHSALRAELARTPKRGLTIITNWQGHPMRPDVVRKEIKQFAADQGFDVVPHGLRKSAVHALLLAGCTTYEVRSITGQSARVVDHYARKIDQHRLGDAAILKLERSGK